MIRKTNCIIIDIICTILIMIIVLCLFFAENLIQWCSSIKDINILFSVLLFIMGSFIFFLFREIRRSFIYDENKSEISLKEFLKDIIYAIGKGMDELNQNVKTHKNFPHLFEFHKKDNKKNSPIEIELSMTNAKIKKGEKETELFFQASGYGFGVKNKDPKNDIARIKFSITPIPINENNNN